MINNDNNEHELSCLIKKAEKINITSNILSTDDNNKFKQLAYPLLKEINNNLDKIKSILSSYIPNNVSVSEIINDNRRQKIIWKILFPYYWNINEKISSFNNQELDQLESIITTGVESNV